MNHVDPIEVFPTVEKMLYKLAWKFSKAQRLPFEDMRSEAYAGFMKACNNYQPKKGMKFSSWCYLGILTKPHHETGWRSAPLCGN